MKVNIGIDEKSSKICAELLGILLADEMLLYVKTLKYHWNVKGPFFGPLHKFFKKQYETLSGFTDEIAERITTLGHPAPGTMEEFLKLTRLKEAPNDYPNDTKMLQNLLYDHENIIRSLREGVDSSLEKHHDAGTSDFLTSLMQKHEQIAWMIRSHLES